MPKKTANSILTKHQKLFAEFLVGECNGNQTDAAMRVGKYKSRNSAAQTAANWMKLPQVAAYVETLREMRTKAMEAQVTAAAVEVGKRQGLERAEHFELLAEIARDGTASPMARVKAIAVSADLKGMMIHKIANLSNEFEGRTPDECEFFAAHGYWPEEAQRVESGDAGATDPPGGSSPPGKPN